MNLLIATMRGSLTVIALLGVLGCPKAPRRPPTEALPTTCEDESINAPMLHGQVVSESGDAIPAFSLDGKPISSANGSFHLRSERGGRRMVVLAPGYASTTFEATMRPGTTTDVGRVIVRKGRLITGRVFDVSTHQPIAGALIDVSNTPLSEEHETQLREEFGAVRSEADGTFTLQAEDGPPSLVVSDPHHIQKWLKLDTGPLNLSIDLDAGGTVEGHVSDSYANDAEIRLVRADGSIWRETCASNHYAFDRIPSGRYFLTVWSTTGQHLHPLYGPVTLQHDGHQRLVFNF